jgi:hypothetical protein
MEIRRTLSLEPPAFSICIPQYNRTSFLIEVCRSLAAQDFSDFEVCISDDCSTDGRQTELLDFLEASPVSYVYYRQSRNLRYDGNLRASIGLSRGRFCFLLGNDDGLASSDTLANLNAAIQRFSPASVVITNYKEVSSGRVFRRVQSTESIPGGPATAIRVFRHFSFVSGILLEGAGARQLATEKWDGSEMYQMFLACRMIAAGGRLLTFDEICIHKDLQVPGERVDSYAARTRIQPCPVEERRLPMGMILPLVADAVSPFHSSDDERQRSAITVAAQLFLFTYAFWMVEFRRVQSWRYAAGVYLGLRPRNILKGIHLSLWHKLQVLLLYACTGLSGLTIPIRIFDALQSNFYAIAKR